MLCTQQTSPSESIHAASSLVNGEARGHVLHAAHQLQRGRQLLPRLVQRKVQPGVMGVWVVVRPSRFRLGQLCSQTDEGKGTHSLVEAGVGARVENVGARDALEVEAAEGAVV